jgi:hypothetical protein
MSKDAWFREFERLEAEHPEKSDDELGDMAHDALVDKLADRADRLHDEAREGLGND